MWGLPEKKINNSFFKIDQSLREKFQNEYGVDKNSIEKTVKKLIEWAAQQPEFPEESTDPEFIENSYALGKYNEETTKKMITGYFRSFNEYPQFFRNIHNYNQVHIDFCYAILLEKLTNNGERVMIFRNVVKNMEIYNFTNFMLISLPFYLLNCHFGGAIPIRIVIDFEGLSFKQYKTIDLTIVMKYATIFKQGLKYRITGFDYINAPSFIENFSNLIKLLLSSKLIGRIFVHENLEALHKYVPKEILPKEYGGPQYTCEEMRDTSNLLTEANRDFFDKIISFVPKNTSSDTIFGAEGTFKALSLD